MRAFILGCAQTDDSSFNVHKTLGSIDTGFALESFNDADFRTSLKTDLVREVSSALGHPVSVVLYDEMLALIDSATFKSYSINDDDKHDCVTNITFGEAEQTKTVLSIQERLNDLWHS